MGRKKTFNEQGEWVKKCPKCGETKTTDQWTFRDKAHTILSTYCNDCDRVRKTLLARERFKDPKKRKDENFRQRLWNRGLTLEQYKAMMEKANHSCEICDSTENLVIDHCHESEKVRGILCWSCNVALGHFKDSKEKLKEAYKYLCQHQHL